MTIRVVSGDDSYLARQAILRVLEDEGDIEEPHQGPRVAVVELPERLRRIRQKQILVSERNERAHGRSGQPSHPGSSAKPNL